MRGIQKCIAGQLRSKYTRVRDHVNQLAFVEIVSIFFRHRIYLCFFQPVILVDDYEYFVGHLDFVSVLSDCPTVFVLTAFTSYNFRAQMRLQSMDKSFLH